MFYSINISIGGIIVKRLHPYIHKEIKAEVLDRTLDESLFINRRVNAEGQLLTKYHFEIPGVDDEEMINIQIAAVKIGNFYLIDYYEIPEVFSGDGSTRIWTLRRPLASESYLPIITVDGEAQAVTIKDIDVGSPAIDRSSNYPANSTLIVKERPVTFSGKITYVEIFAYQAMASVTVATFTQVGENIFMARDSEFIGDVGGDYKRPFEVNLDVVAGDFIGIFWGAGYIERDDKGEGTWVKTGDQTSCSEVTFEFKPNRSISLYASEIVPAGNVYVNKSTGRMHFGTIPKKVPDNIIVKYVPKYPIHIVSWVPESREPGLISYLLICEEI